MKENCAPVIPLERPGFKALLDNLTYKDLLLEADVTPPPAGDAGLIFRVNKPSIGANAFEGYYAGVSASGKHVILGRADGYKWTPLKVVEHLIPNDASTRLTVIARGNRIEVRVNKEAMPVISLTDDQWTSGQAGLRMYTTDKNRAISSFDNVRVVPSN